MLCCLCEQGGDESGNAPHKATTSQVFLHGYREVLQVLSLRVCVVTGQSPALLWALREHPATLAPLFVMYGPAWTSLEVRKVSGIGVMHAYEINFVSLLL